MGPDRILASMQLALLVHCDVTLPSVCFEPVVSLTPVSPETWRWGTNHNPLKIHSTEKFLPAKMIQITIIYPPGQSPEAFWKDAQHNHEASLDMGRAAQEEGRMSLF